MAANPLFEQTIMALLAGDVICEYQHDSLYNYLSVPGHQQQVSSFLAQMNRVLRTTSDQGAWLCAFESTKPKEVKDSIRKRFDEVANNLEPLVAFLRLVMTSEGNQRPVTPGDRISEGALLEQISNAPSLESRLRSLTESKYFRTQKADSALQLRTVIKKLEDEGFLKRLGSSGSQFIATGRWTLLYDLMGFIQAHEGIADSGGYDDEQMRML